MLIPTGAILAIPRLVALNVQRATAIFAIQVDCNPGRWARPYERAAAATAAAAAIDSVERGRGGYSHGCGSQLMLLLLSLGLFLRSWLLLSRDRAD